MYVVVVIVIIFIIVIVVIGGLFKDAISSKYNYNGNELDRICIWKDAVVS